MTRQGDRQVTLRLALDSEGATAVEYGIMLASIAAIIFAVVLVVGQQTEGNFDSSCKAFGAEDSPIEETCD